MKTADEWFDAYSESHQNPTNKLIHWVCVPSILFSIIGLLWTVSPLLTWAVMAVSLLFYFPLSMKLSLVMMVIYALMTSIATALGSYLLITSVVIFVVAWIFQFVGHHVEGKKPSFFEDLKFLLVGPIWCLSFLFKKYNLSY